MSDSVPPAATETPEGKKAVVSGPPPLPPILEPAAALFEQGDYRGARAAVAAILASGPSPEVTEAAKIFRSRMDIDPWAARIGLLALGLLALVIGIYVL